MEGPRDFEWFGNILFDKFKILARLQMGYIARRTCQQIIDCDHLKTVIDKPVAQMASQKSRPA
jgi:hypothetical protein